MKKNGRTINEDIRITIRGIREFDQILPRQMTLLTFKSVIAALTPYITVVMSAVILNELVGAQNRIKLLICILLSIGATFLLNGIGCFLDAKISVAYSRLFSTHEIILTDKAYRIPFCLLENEKTRSLREQVSGSIGLSGAGMASLYWDMDVVVKNLCSAVIAFGLGLNFMSQVMVGVRRGEIGGSAAVTILILLAGLIVVCSYVTCKISSKRFDVSFDVFEQGAKYNRYGEFYTMSYLPDEDMAMDIRIFRQKKLILEESQKKCYQILAQGDVKEMKARNRLDVSKAACAGICSAAVYAMVGFLAIREVVGIGNVMMICSAVTMLITAFSELAQIITDLRNNNVHLLNYFRYMDLMEEGHSMEEDHSAEGKIETKTEETEAEKEEVGMEKKETEAEKGEEAGKKTVACSRNDSYEIVFEKVSFKYPESEEMALRDVDLRIAPGEKLAIVGENGSGKTTLIKLLCRLYRPTAGRILWNGVDIWDYPYAQYIRSIATVFQDFSLFAFPIAENVAASKEYDEEKVYEALCRAGLQKKIDQLPKGIRQAISHDYEEDGMDLSGGEAQKTAIARAIYKAAPIVILDEPTAALDPYAEKEIYEQFFRNLADETMLSISHRLSSCRLCDRIAVLHGGQLVQQGSHEELLGQTEGKYTELWEMQAQYYA